MDETGPKRVYVYRIGGLTHAFVSLLAGSFAAGGLYVIVNAIVTGPLENLFGAVLGGVACFLAAAVLFRWLHKDSLSSQTVVLCGDKVQLPMTGGENDSDYLFLKDVIGTEIDRDYHDHGPALVVATKSKPVAYKSIHFDGYKSFEDFCDRFDSALEDNNAPRISS